MNGKTKFAVCTGLLLALAACEQAGQQHSGSASRQTVSPEVATAPTVLQRAAPQSIGKHAAAPANVAPIGREAYDTIVSNQVTRVADNPVSTFSVDVDTAAYANVRRFLEAGTLPPGDAVRVEELVNYFHYDYPVPDSLDRPFSIVTELAPTPWNPKTHLLHIGLQGYDVAQTERPPANLVFLIDVSGSMQSADKLPLVKNTLRLLTSELRPQDSVAIAVYAGAAGTVLEPTPGDKKSKILAAINRLQAGGSTAGGAGLELAYTMAAENFDPDGVNRVLLATDGDFNVGTTDHRRLEQMIVENRRSGVALSVLGFGTGNYNDALMERISNAGNGSAAYIDSLREARKVLVEELNASLLTIASDVKIQIEFNPARVAEYRLIGYENRVLREQDFTDDRVDAGDIGAGHSVTAIYEIALKGNGGERLAERRYRPTPAAADFGDEIASLKLRYKNPSSTTSEPIARIVRASQIRPDLTGASRNFRFSAAVAAFGQLLRGGDGMADFTLDDVVVMADGARGKDDGGYRAEFLQLARLARDLQN